MGCNSIQVGQVYQFFYSLKQTSVVLGEHEDALKKKLQHSRELVELEKYKPKFAMKGSLILLCNIDFSRQMSCQNTEVCGLNMKLVTTAWMRFEEQSRNGRNWI